MNISQQELKLLAKRIFSYLSGTTADDLSYLTDAAKTFSTSTIYRIEAAIVSIIFTDKDIPE